MSSASRSISSHSPLKTAAFSVGPAAMPFDDAATKKSSGRGGGVTRYTRLAGSATGAPSGSSTPIIHVIGSAGFHGTVRQPSIAY